MAPSLGESDHERLAFPPIGAWLMPYSGMTYGPIRAQQLATNQGKKKRLARQQRANAKKPK